MDQVSLCHTHNDCLLLFVSRLGSPDNNCPLLSTMFMNVSNVTVIISNNVVASGTNEAVASAFGIAIMFITVAYAR